MTHHVLREPLHHLLGGRSKGHVAFCQIPHQSRLQACGE